MPGVADGRTSRGCWGGVWGTLGYDLIRVPLHFLGLNPFAPIRSYGMFALGASHSSLATDWAGAAYHFSNGVAFGWMYALVMYRRHWAWGVLWGLVLESFAVGTAYGAVYGIRDQPQVLFIAYFAHVFYGLPLGWAVMEPERVRAVTRKAWSWLATTVGVVAVAAVLALAWERPWTRGPVPAGTVEIGPDAIVHGWTRVSDGPLTLVNRADRPVRVEVPGAVSPLVLSAGSSTVLALTPGLYQVRAPDEPWRSAFLSIERGGFPLP